MKHTLPDGLQLYYEIHGNTSASQRLILLNGVTQSTLAWYFLLPSFQTYEVVLVDFIFQGQSDKNSPVRSFDQHADDLMNLITSLPAKENIPVGISYGGMVTQHLLYRYPQFFRRAVLLSTMAYKTDYFRAIEVAWHRALACGGYSLLLDIMLPYVLSESYFENPLIPIEEMKKMRATINTAAEPIFKLMAATRERKDFRTELAQIQATCLVIHGQADLLFPVSVGKAVAEALPNADFVVIPNAGHTLNLEGIPLVAQAIEQFLQRTN
ncbi:MAG: alpha/beta hydrolase [Bacteroidia bacterium]|nr:alpha/beta hydrolase [Bacteroidia bacterium]